MAKNTATVNFFTKTHLVEVRDICEKFHTLGFERSQVSLSSRWFDLYTLDGEKAKNIISGYPFDGVVKLYEREKPETVEIEGTTYRLVEES